MSHRIFVNTYNKTFHDIVNNSKGDAFGLGVPSAIEESDSAEFQQKPYEIYFTANDLREKQRKINILIDSLLDTKFWAGSGEYSGDENSLTTTSLVTAITKYMPESRRYLLPTITNAIVEGATTYTDILNRRNTEFTKGGLETRIDNAAPWKMTRPDFPNITGQAIQGNSNKRAIIRLYDDRGGALFGIGMKNVSTEEAIALLVRESLADALYCTTASPYGITPPEHPGPGGNGNAEKWINRDALKKTFNFKHVNTGNDKVVRTYVNALDYLLNYIEIIDKILNLQDPTLSRSPDVEQAEIRIPIKINLSTATVNLFDALASTTKKVVREKVLTFFDENREYKTLLNFGNDRQYVAEAWRIAPKDTDSLQLKLTKPLDIDIAEQDTTFISRELAKSVIEGIDFELSPAADPTPYLRPYVMDSRNYVDSKMISTNNTLTTLGLITGSAGTIQNSTTVSYEDAVFRRWFTGDFKASELNIDFTDYNNFVHFGSAYKRLYAFNEKLLKIDELTSASIYAGVSASSVSGLLKAKEKEEIIRKFDPYEQFLYYSTASLPYSASAFYVTNEIEYNPTGSWPKQADGTIYSPYSTTAINWLNTQLDIAQRYDYNNPNYLILNLPKHIQEDEESTDFLTLVEMVGHLMDNIKVYIDQFPNIYSTNINPLEELTMDQVYEVAQSFGIELPNVYALENLETFNAQFSGEEGSRSYVAETWKRFIHSMVYFAKTKGSRTSFDALLNTYGINSPVLQIKETTYPSPNNYIRSDELTYGLRFTSSIANRISVPFVSSSLTASTLQISFNPILRQSSSLVTSTAWAIDLVPHPSSSKLNYGRVEVVSGSSRTQIATSSYFPLFSDDYTHIMLRSQSGDITIIQTDGDQILFKESALVNLSSVWNNSTFIYLGGTGSIKLSNNFDGIVDEVRVWGENISDSDFESQAYDPGSYYGANYTSSYTSLYVHIPFSQPLSSITQSVTNESPYQNVSIVASLPAVGFTTGSFSRILRSIKQFTPLVGSTVYTNNKVIVAPPPVFNEQFIDETGTPILSRNSSIKKIEEKQYNSGQNVVYFGVSPTDFINQNIIRSMGVIDVNNIIGSPRYMKKSTYFTLSEIQKDYIEFFNHTVQPNEFIRFFKDLTQGPSEMAQEMVPARAKLLDGIVIESPIVSRNKDNLVKYLAVDGAETKKFNNYVSGSGSIGIGAYNFNQMINELVILPSSVADTLPISATIYITSSVVPKSSTKSNKLPPFRRVIQKIDVGNVFAKSYSYATSSMLDENSAYVTLEAVPVDTRISSSVVLTGYAREPYYGIPASGSIIARLPSEENTIEPFYNIPPRSDLTEVGTTSYFHKINGIYSYDIYTKYKTPYLVRLDTDVTGILDRLYADITLLSPSSALNYPGRKKVTIPYPPRPDLTDPTKIGYLSGSYNIGAITVDDIFTLLAVSGTPGLRVRLYSTELERTTDKNRPFATPPAMNSGVLFDGILDVNEVVFPYLPVQTNNSLIYYSVDNTTATDIVSNIELFYFAYEPARFIPSGYLPRHYKFSRDNTTALKRRNYLGCRDVNTSYDGQPPVIVSITNTNTVVVNSNTTQTTSGGDINIPTDADGITFGGAGKLNVS